MRGCIKRGFTCLLFLFITLLGIGQELPNCELGIQAGGMFYLGDINHVPFKFTKPAGGLFYRHNFNTRYSVKGIFAFSQVGADDAKAKSQYQKERGYSFTGNFFNLFAMGEFNFMPFGSSKVKNNFTPYIQAGVGVDYNTKVKIDQIALSLPFGIGVKYNHTKKIGYGADFIMVKVFSDKIDYYAPNSTESVLQKQRTSYSNDDWLSYFTIYLSYRIEYPKKCPSFD